MSLKKFLINFIWMQKFFQQYGRSKRIQKKVTRLGDRLLLIKQRHLGSDHLPQYIEEFSNYLEEKGVTIKECTNVTDIESIKEDEHIIRYEELKEKKEVKSKNVVIAPGRTGAKWIQELADKYNIPYLSKSIEIGVRVEVRKEVLEEICSVIYDPTIFIKTKTYNDEIRTFCTNPGGFVAKENYYGYICVNGHSLKDIKSNNSNFAFISKVNLTEPVTNTREYGESIAKIANVCVKPASCRHKNKPKPRQAHCLRLPSPPLRSSHPRRMGAPTVHPFPHRPQGLPRSPNGKRNGAYRQRQKATLRQRGLQRQGRPPLNHRIQSSLHKHNPKSFRATKLLQHHTPHKISHSHKRHEPLLLSCGLRSKVF